MFLVTVLLELIMSKFNHIFLSVNARMELKIDILRPTLRVDLFAIKLKLSVFSVLEPAEFKN